MSNIMAAYNPDVLSCLANLSNDEVFTPPEIANKMLDMLPQELFKSPDTKFLDPACKSGVFLREIAKRLLEGLMPGYKDWLERIDDKKRENEELDDEEKEFLEQLQATVDHIFKEQLYGIAITELTSLLSRRSLYCSKYPNSDYSVTKFDNPSGNIRFVNKQHRFKDGKCVFCGANAEQYDREEGLETHAYEFIHTVKPEEILNMKFDVIIGNPPYQMNDGGSGNGISAKPIYHHFVQQAKKLNPRYLSMIIPARWYAGGKGLEEFRMEMLNDGHIVQLVDYPKSRECFNGVDIAGGVCYFLRDRDNEKICKVVSRQKDNETIIERRLNEFDIFVRDNTGIKIIHKILSKKENMMNEYVFTRNPFGFVSSERGFSAEFTNSIKLISSAGVGYVKQSDVSKNIDVIPKYKVMIGKINPDRGGVNNASDGKSNVITKIRIIEPNVVFTETYLMLGAFSDKVTAENCASYFSCKFTRALISLTLSSMNISTQNFQFVPVQDFSKPWTDEELYAKYELTQEEIDFIESMIKPMDLGGDDNG